MRIHKPTATFRVEPFFVIPGLASEKGQALARAGWVLILAFYLSLVHNKFVGTLTYQIAWSLALAHALFATTIAVAVHQQYGGQKIRRILAVVVDQVLLAALLYLTGDVGAPFVLAPLFFTFGTGLRYSRGHAIFASALSSTCICLVLLFSDYWQQYAFLRFGLIVASIYLPFYVFRLTDAVALAMRIDPLTGLKNRTGFDELLNRACENLQTATYESVVILIDLDGFKRVNDEQGHDGGDAVLKHVGFWLNSELNAFGTAARFGGDEFAVVIENLKDRTALEDALAAFLERTENVGKLFESKLGASIGVSYFLPKSTATPSYMYKTADQLMYKAKRQGKNQIATSSGCQFSENGGLLTEATPLNSLTELSQAMEFF